jgi:histone-lysine N-methyltransferase SETD3
VLLIGERSLGEKSFWAPYIGILPTAEEVGQSWLWDEDDLAFLEGSGLVAATASLRAKLDREYADLVSDIVRPNGLDESVYSKEAFDWAMSMLFSRAVNLQETREVGLVPYADLFNHSPYAASYFYFQNVPLPRSGKWSCTPSQLCQERPGAHYLRPEVQLRAPPPLRLRL